MSATIDEFSAIFDAATCLHFAGLAHRASAARFAMRFDPPFAHSRAAIAMATWRVHLVWWNQQFPTASLTPVACILMNG